MYYDFVVGGSFQKAFKKWAQNRGGGVLARVLARISKIHVQDHTFKISACPDLANQPLQILIPATFISLIGQRGQFKHLSYVVVNVF